MAADSRARSGGVFSNPVSSKRTASVRNALRIPSKRDGAAADESDPRGIDEPDEQTLRPRVSVECDDEREDQRKRNGPQDRSSTSVRPCPSPLHGRMRHPPRSETQQRSRRGQHRGVGRRRARRAVDRSQTLASAAEAIKPRIVTRDLRLVGFSFSSCVSMCVPILRVGKAARERASLQSGRLAHLVRDRWTIMSGIACARVSFGAQAANQFLELDRGE